MYRSGAYAYSGYGLIHTICGSYSVSFVNCSNMATQ